VLEAEVLEVRGDRITLGAGARDAVVPGTRFLLCRTTDGGEVARLGDALVQAVVDSVEADRSSAEVWPRGGGRAVQQGDRAHAR